MDSHRRSYVRRYRLLRAAIATTATVCLIAALEACRSRSSSCEGPYCAEVLRVVPLIEKSIGLEFKRPPRVEERSREQVREFVLRELDDPRNVRELGGIEAAYKRFGLIPDTLRLREFLLSLLEEQIVGYYDPRTKVLYVVQGAPQDIAQLTLTHELVHALQDQYVDLQSFQTIEGQNDRQSAAQAVFEGQAVFEQIAVMLGGGNVAVNLPGGWDRVRETIRANQGSMPVFAAAPLVIQETLIFPYLSGAEFVRNFKARRPGDSPFEDLPVSTEQIMHPNAFFGRRDAPARFTLALRAPARYENTLGEFETRLLLFEYTRDQNDAVRGASGWDGDRYALIPTAGGEALVWATVWDSPVEAAEFRDVMQRGLERRLEVAGSGDVSSRTFAAGARTVRLSAAEAQGRPLVIYVDAPTGALLDVLDVGATRVDER
jgi:hypothetical protein